MLGQEMAGYATGEVFFVSQLLEFRHSHLDAGGYSYDQKYRQRDVDGAIDFLVRDEQDRVFLTSMVSCLFAREVYDENMLTDCLNAIGYGTLAENREAVSQRIQKLRWKTRVATGFKPEEMRLPGRFTEVTTINGPVEGRFLNALKDHYARRINEMAKDGGGAE